MRPTSPLAFLPLSLLLLPALVLSQVDDCEPTKHFQIDDIIGSAAAYGNTVNVFMPPGCSCKESDVAKSECVIFDCDCKCDLTAGACDMNCCCDSECTAEQTQFFTEKDLCLDPGVSDPVYETCYSPYEVGAVNPKYPMRSDDSAENAYKNLLCVQTDNSGTKGIFFETGTTRSELYPSADEAFVTGPDCTTTFDYSCWSPSATISSDEHYLLGDTIAATTGDGSTNMAAAFGGLLPLPVADQSGICNEANSVKFGEYEEEANKCKREKRASDLQNQCEELDFDFDRFTKDFYVGSTQNAKDSISATSTAGFVQVEVATVSKAGANVYDYRSTGDVLPVTTWNTGTSTCENALKSLCYEVTYNDVFNIIAVTARVEVEDIVESSSAEYVDQEFSVEFSMYGDPNTARSIENNNYVNRTRSGNPGYIFGRPVLAGRKHILNDAAVMADTSGFQVMSGVNGECDVSTGDFSASDANRGTTVGFGEDSSVGCTLSLTEAQLKAMCGGTSHTGDYLYDYSNEVKMPWWLTSMNNLTSTTKVGIFGNADPMDITQWIDVTEKAPTFSATFSDTTLTCSNFPTATHYKFQWTYVGSTTNPQAKIMSARVEYSTSPMTFLDKRVAGATQKFPFTVTVDWTYKELNSEKYSPPPPPIIFSVPYDVFYPFQIDNAAGRNGGSWIVIGLAAIGASLASLFLI
ncbi:hypothetical protein TrST_g8857 [Triparma strigata]|uniref:Tectonic domain-containing protein n=1 Tax=Triparma strigata TaxID=1606541 RepID=A0A9W7F040_9STRA|nr:hypothetical protein TrST_g8857 [Triparma strigata]